MSRRLRGDNHSDTRERNIRMVLRSLTAYGPLSRRQISELSGLAPGTITGLVGELLDRGVLVPVGNDRAIGSRGGPSRILLDFNPAGVAVVGVALGVFGRGVSLTGPRGEMIGQDYLLDYSSQSSIEDQIDWISETALRLIRESGLPEQAVIGVGVGAEGRVDPRIGDESLVPYGAWQAYPIARELERRIGKPVVVASAVHAEAAGEIWFNQGRGADSLLCVSIGTTIGTAAVVDDEVVRGYRDLAGDFGHIVLDPEGPACVCGKRGCLEAIAGVQALRAAGQAAVLRGESRDMAERCGGRPDALTSEMVAAAAGDGDPAAVGIVSAAAGAIGRALAPVVATLGPEYIVLLGEVPRRSGNLMIDRIGETIASTGSSPSYPTPAIVHGAVQVPPGTALGAAALALDRFFFSPQLARRGTSTEVEAVTGSF